MVEPPKAHCPFGFACSVVLRTSCGESVSRRKAKGKGSAAQPYARHASSVLPENAGATHSPCGWTERCQSITKNRRAASVVAYLRIDGAHFGENELFTSQRAQQRPPAEWLRASTPSN
jgi:hypothetical protein